jgi:membrane fusion protein (multidrug efflux system)
MNNVFVSMHASGGTPSRLAIRLTLAGRPLLYFGFAMVLSLAACGPKDAAGTPPAGGGRGGRGGAPAGPTPVEIAVAHKSSLVRSTTVTGTVQPIRIVGVTSVLSGTLLRITAEEGKQVRAGDVLAEMDVRELSAQLRSAEAGLALATSNFQRAEALRRENVISQAEFERDRAALAASQASVDQLRTRVAFASITAPVSGVVVTKGAEMGDVISGQTQIFTIAVTDTLVTRLAVSELEVSALRVGAVVPLTVDALQGATVQGRIRRIFPAADVATRLVPVEVAISGRSVTGLLPGFTVRAKLALDEARQGITVPTRALQGGASSRFLFVLKANKAQRRVVSAGDDIEGLSEILSGVDEGDTVVVAGNALLRDGATVRVVDPLRGEAGSAAASGRGAAR